MREKRRNKEWTEQELEILRAHYRDTAAKDLAELLPGRTVSAITNKPQTKEPKGKCAGCEWGRPLGSSGNMVMCIWPTCIKEKGPC